MSKATTDFISKNANDVIKSVSGTGIFPSIKMAQMIIESSGKDEHGNFVIGRGLAVRKANNYFGIKASAAWKGKTVALSTPKDGKPVSMFRVYPTALDSLKDHSQFLLVNSRYKTNGVFVAKTPQAQSEALQRSGYSESPTYGKALIGIINAYHLESLDGKKIVTGTNINSKTVVVATNTNTKYIVAGGLVMVFGAYYFRNQLIGKPQNLLTN